MHYFKRKETSGPEPPTPPPPPTHTHTVYVYTVYLLYSHREGEQGKSWTREKGQRGNSSQSWVENTNMTDSISSL